MDSERDETISPTPESEDFGSDNGFGYRERESRSYSRESTWKRRDQSWDKKWKEQVKRIQIGT